MNLTRFIIVFALLCTLPVWSQDYLPPSSYVMDEPEDYQALNDEVLECVSYLNRLEPKSNSSAKEENVKFLREWIIGTPDVEVQVSQYLVNLVDRNEQLVSIYINGWVKHAIEHDEMSKDEFSHHVAALNALIDYYVRFESQLVKDPDVKSLIKKRDKNALELWLRRELG